MNDVMETYDHDIPYLGLGLGLGLRIRSRVRVRARVSVRSPLNLHWNLPLCRVFQDHKFP